MTKELADFFSPNYNIEKVLTAALTFTERKKMKEWSKKKEEYVYKIEQLEDELKLYQDYTKLNINQLIERANIQNTDKEELLAYIDKLEGQLKIQHNISKFQPEKEK